MSSNPNIEIHETGYVVTIFSGVSDPVNEENDNVDVRVTFEDGSFYSATLFTLRNLETLFNKNGQTGECAFGLYFSCTDMVIVENLRVETIRHVGYGI